MLTDGAIEALLMAASPALRDKYAAQLIAGTWTGTMNLTEPQAGSDLAAVRTRAEPQADGTYRLDGTKIFITWGEHDMADNIVHLVLARLPDAPPGVKGISLFVAPKFLVGEDGSLGERNGVLVDALYEGRTEQFIETQVKFEDGRTGSVSATLQIIDAKIHAPAKVSA